MMQRIDHMSQQRLNLRAIALQQLGRFSSYNTILFSALLIYGLLPYLERSLLA